MKYVQYLNFELSLGCNLAKEHAQRCPVNDLDRWKNLRTDKPMTDDQIIQAAEISYKYLGFRGAISFHFYNEPLLAKDRMKMLIARIKSVCLNAKFNLHTNGTLISKEYQSDLSLLDEIHITNYHNLDFSWAYDTNLPIKSCINIVSLDDRLNGKGVRSNERCLTVFREIDIDYFGNAHPCCHDWRGDIRIGNIHDSEGFRLIVKKYKKFRRIVGEGQFMMEEAPERCLTCYWGGQNGVGGLGRKTFGPLVNDVYEDTCKQFHISFQFPWWKMKSKFKMDFDAAFASFRKRMLKPQNEWEARYAVYELGELLNDSQEFSRKFHKGIMEIDISEALKNLFLLEFNRALKNYIEVIRIADILIEQNKVFRNVFLFKGISLRKIGKLKDALNCMNAEENLRGEQAEIFVQKSHIYRLLFNNSKKSIRDQRISEAKTMIKKGLEINSTCLWLHSEMGLLLEMEGDFKAALRCFLTEEKIRPNRDVVMNNITRIKSKLGH